MSKPDYNKQPEKPKEYVVSNYDLSELSFIAMMLRAKQEEEAFFNERMRVAQLEIQKRLSIPTDWEINWGQVYSTGKIFARKPQPKPQAKVEIKENAEPELQPKQS